LSLNPKIFKNYEFEEFKSFRMITSGVPKRLMKMFTAKQALVEDSDKEDDDSEGVESGAEQSSHQDSNRSDQSSSRRLMKKAYSTVVVP
jgi:hypothetical protein